MQLRLAIALWILGGLVPLNAGAQMRGGGHSSGGARMGGGAGFHGAPGFAGPQFGARGMAPRGPAMSRGFALPARPGFSRFSGQRFGHRGFNSGFGLAFDFDRDRGFRGRDGFFHHRHRGNFFFGGFPVYAYYPYAYAAPSYADYYPERSYNDYNYAAQPDTNAINQAYQQGALQQQVADLSNQVESLRAEMQTAAPRNSARPTTQGGNEASSEPPITLVFRDGHRAEVHNYALAGDSFWIVNERAAKKIPIS